jgi:hypothetical protein
MKKIIPFLLLLLSLQSNAQAVLDQQVFDISGSSTSNSAIRPTVWQAQTYTAGISGGLTKVEVFIRCNRCTVAGNPDLLFKIFATDASGVPSGSALANATIPSFTTTDVAVTRGYEWKTITLSSPINQVLGTKYTIVLTTATERTDFESYNWRYANTTYSGGGTYLSSDGTSWSVAGGPQTFRTYVNSALPVSLLYFRGNATQTAEGYASELTWATDSEVNAKSYTIERSRDLQTFTTLNNQPAAGNSTEQKEYAYTDSKPFFGTNYYRLSQIDFDGSVHRYQPVAVIIEDRDMPFGVFPNPVSGNRFKVKVENADEAQLSLVNELGQKIDIETSKLSETIVEVQAKTELPTGSFVMKVKGLVGERSYKLVVKN